MLPHLLSPDGTEIRRQNRVEVSDLKSFAELKLNESVQRLKRGAEQNRLKANFTSMTQRKIRRALAHIYR